MTLSTIVSQVQAAFYQWKHSTQYVPTDKEPLTNRSQVSQTVSAWFRTRDLSRVRRTWLPLHYIYLLLPKLTQNYHFLLLQQWHFPLSNLSLQRSKDGMKKQVRKSKTSRLKTYVTWETSNPVSSKRIADLKDFMDLQLISGMTPVSPKSYFVLRNKETFSCFRPVSVQGPFACKANVITTTLRKRLWAHFVEALTK